MADEYVARFNVNFEKKELQSLKVDGLGDQDAAELQVFARDHCSSASCSGKGCAECKLRRVYKADARSGGCMEYSTHQEYLYCLQFKDQNVKALLVLTPREQNVEVAERALLSRRQSMEYHRGLQEDATSMDSELPSRLYPTYTSRYLPSMEVLYRVKKETMSVRLPQPEQLRYPLVLRQKPQADAEEVGQEERIALTPNEAEGKGSLHVSRGKEHVLQVRHELDGDWLDLLDFHAGSRLLRIQESKDAPQHMNFLVEKPMEERGTFLIHMSFDEKPLMPQVVPIGEFSLEVDDRAQTLKLMTTEKYANVEYRVERLHDSAEPGTQEELELVMGGCVDPNTLSMTKSGLELQKKRLRISVKGPDAAEFVPISVLTVEDLNVMMEGIQRSNVMLMVAVQHPEDAADSNLNNMGAEVASVGNSSQLGDAFFCCPLRQGRCRLRVAHGPQAAGADSDTRDRTSRSLIVAESDDTEFNLDVDMKRLRARLLPMRHGADCGTSEFVVVESDVAGFAKANQLRLYEEFEVRRSCTYTVAAAGQPLFSFDVADIGVGNIRPRSRQVRLTRRLVHEADSALVPAVA